MIRLFEQLIVQKARERFHPRVFELMCDAIPPGMWGGHELVSGSTDELIVLLRDGTYITIPIPSSKEVD